MVALGERHDDMVLAGQLLVALVQLSAQGRLSRLVPGREEDVAGLGDRTGRDTSVR